jgi:hypothetical protein
VAPPHASEGLPSPKRLRAGRRNPPKHTLLRSFRASKGTLSAFLLGLKDRGFLRRRAKGTLRGLEAEAPRPEGRSFPVRWFPFIRLRRRPRALPVDECVSGVCGNPEARYHCFGGFRHRRITLRSLGVGGYSCGGTTGLARGAPLTGSFQMSFR